VTLDVAILVSICDTLGATGRVIRSWGIPIIDHYKCPLAFVIAGFVGKELEGRSL